MNPWQAFFGWPDGGVWANILAWVIGLVLAGACGWLFRDHIGRHLAAWLHHHHQAHLGRLAADAPVRAGAGSNPAEGLTADAAAPATAERVVPSSTSSRPTQPTRTSSTSSTSGSGPTCAGTASGGG